MKDVQLQDVVVLKCFEDIKRDKDGVFLVQLILFLGKFIHSSEQMHRLQTQNIFQQELLQWGTTGTTNQLQPGFLL